jgi:predicted dehydrogenase
MGPVFRCRQLFGPIVGGLAGAFAYGLQHPHALCSLKRAYGDYKELVAADDLDVIYVATPHNMHHAGVTLALNAA